MGPIWWVRLARWARKPPSRHYVRIVVFVVAMCAIVLAADWIFEFELKDPGVNPRRGPNVSIEIVSPEGG